MIWGCLYKPAALRPFCRVPDRRSICLPPASRVRQMSADPALSNVHCAPPVCRHRISGSLSLPSRGPFHLSFTVLFAIGHQGVFSLTGWSPLFPTKFLVFRGTLESASFHFASAYGAFTLFGRLFQNLSASLCFRTLRSLPRSINTPVWASPRSLAATYGITFVFFSSAYLDVSVQRVSPCIPMDSVCSD